jgi:hypothetical protein
MLLYVGVSDSAHLVTGFLGGGQINCYFPQAESIYAIASSVPTPPLHRDVGFSSEQWHPSLTGLGWEPSVTLLNLSVSHVHL